MRDVVFLTKDQVLQVHKKAILDYGGTSSIRDNGLFESAISQPEASFGGIYLHETIYLMAAAYYSHISQNQPFIDGNKRTAFLSLYTFLKINGYVFNASNKIIFPILLEVAQGKKSKEDLANFIEQHSTKIQE